MRECCPECYGEGFVVICCDDICQGRGECIHGDGGHAMCLYCEGEGYVKDDGDCDGYYEEDPPC